MKLSAVLLVVFCTYVAAQTGFPKFKAIYTAVEQFTDSQGMQDTREFQGTIYYQNDWNENTGSGRDRMLLEIDLVAGTTTKTLQELTIWEDQFFKYTICDGQCAWQDIFAEDPMPQLYWNGESGGTPDGTINGQSVERFDIDGTNVVDIVTTDFVTLWVRTGSNRWVERAQITYNKGQGNDEIVRTLTFTNQEDDFGNNRLRVPNGCPDIEPGCFRLDLVFVIDLSGSVGSAGPGQELTFISSLTSNFLMDAKHLACGLVSFSYCRNAAVQQPVTYDKSAWLAQLAAFSFSNNGWTCIVGGIQRGFWLFSTANGSRAATAKALIVITDGNGNRPCNHVGPYQWPDSDCYEFGDIPSGAFNGEIQGCSGTSPCNGQLCCQSMHNWHLNEYYQLFYDLYNPVIYAIGVGVAVSDATLEQIINDPDAIAANEPRKFNVNNFAELNTIIAVIIAAILCDVPGSQECPNDCRPGGFCCAGGCICSLDCAETEKTECQIGFCFVDGNGARCKRGPPQDSVCQNQASVQCEDRYCEEDVGCLGTANTNLTCTDNNVCTIDVCVDVNGAGVCNSTRNQSVSTCTDFNDCTFNDECQDPDGECLGTTNDLLPCDDDNACTTTGCRNGTCSVLETKSCEDDDTSDCIVWECDPDDGECKKVPVEEGVECAINNSGDNCTVFVCDKFDPEDYNECVDDNNGDDSSCDKGECRERTRDLDECESTSDNTGAIIGGVIAGIAFIAILILLLLIFLLILCRKQVGSVLGNLAAFAPEMNIVTSPTYAEKAGNASSAAYDGGL